MKVTPTKTEVQADNGVETAISPAEIRHALTCLVQSKYFAHAPKKQKFVQVIAEYYLQGRAAELNEYLLGCEVFGKGTDYHPAADPVVRVAAHDVRKKLEAYYKHEGAQDGVRMSVPLGTYMPVFSRNPTQAKSLEAVTDPSSLTEEKKEPPAPGELSRLQPAASPTTRLVSLFGPSLLSLVARRFERGAKPLLLSAGVVILLLLMGNVWLLLENRALQHRPATMNAPVTATTRATSIWEPFLTNQFSTLLILSNPVVYRTMNGADPEILSKKGIVLTHEQSHLLTDYSNSRLPLRANQPLRLIPAFNTYTGIGEAIGGYRLHGLLQNIGEPSLLKQSRSVGADDLKEHDIILLGSVYSNQWAKPLSIKENFVYTTRTTIENLQPQAGEAREFISSFDQRTGALLEDYALITVVPGVTETNVVMSLSGIYSEGTQAAVEYVTNNNRLIELQNRLREISGGETVPPYFQALLKVRVENSFPTQTTLLHVRGLKAASSQ